MDWSIFPLIVSLIIVVAAVFVPRLTGLRPHRPAIVSAALAALAFIGRLVYLSAIGSTLWDENIDNTLSVLGLLLLINSVIELIKRVILDLGERQGARLPRFLLDVFGFVVLLLFVPSIARRFYDAELTGLLVGSTVASAVIALSLQSLLSSFFAGIALQIESPFRPDDWVQVDGQEGRVVRMNWRTLALVTRMNETVILPNGSVAQQKIINFSRPSDLQAIDTMMGVAYEAPPGEVKALLKRATEQVTGVVSDRAVEVMVWEYADSAIVYRVRFWIRDYAIKYRILDQVQTRFWYVLKRANYTIPFPQRDVHMIPVNDGSAESPEDTQANIGHILRRVELFKKFSEAQCIALGRGATRITYTYGEALVRQGDGGDSLFIIERGEVSIVTVDEHGHQIPLDNRFEGDFLGEMSLLTGEPRTATAVAVAETSVIVIDADTFRDVVAEDRNILAKLMTALEDRRSNAESQVAKHHKLFEQDTPQNNELMRRVYRFLGL